MGLPSGPWQQRGWHHVPKGCSVPRGCPCPKGISVLNGGTVPKGDFVLRGRPLHKGCPVSKGHPSLDGGTLSEGSPVPMGCPLPTRCPVPTDVLSEMGVPAPPAPLHGTFSTLLTPWHSWAPVSPPGHPATPRGPPLTQLCPPSPSMFSLHPPPRRQVVRGQLTGGLYRCFAAGKRGLGSLRGTWPEGLGAISKTRAVILLLWRENRAPKCV